MADMMPMAAPMGGGPVFDPNEQRWQDTVTTREPTHSRTTGQESGQLAPQTLAATEETIAAQQNLAQTRAQAMPAAQAMDAAALAKAQAQQADAAATITAQQAAASKYEAQLQTAMAEMKARGAAYAEAAKPEVQSFGSRVAAAIGMALGAYAATRAGTPNYAAQIVQMMQTKAEKEHEQRIAAALRLYESSGAAPGQIMAARKAAMEEIQAAKVARANEIEAQYQAAISKNPNHAQKLSEELAEKKLAEDKDRRNFLAQHLAQTTRSTDANEDQVRTTASVQGSGNAGSGQPQRETVNELVASRQQAELLKEFEAIVKRNPKAWEAYRDANKDIAQFDIAKQGGLGGILKLGQAAGAAPISLDQRLDKLGDPKVAEDAKRINQIWPIIQTGEARILDPVGVLNEASQEAARKHLNMYTMKPAEAEKLSQQFRRQHEERAEMLGAGKQMRATEATIQRAKDGASGGGSKIPPQVFKRIQEANRVKKGDPDYAEAQKYVREMAAKYGR